MSPWSAEVPSDANGNLSTDEKTVNTPGGAPLGTLPPTKNASEIDELAVPYSLTFDISPTLVIDTGLVAKGNLVIPVLYAGCGVKCKLTYPFSNEFTNPSEYGELFAPGVIGD